MNLHLIAMIGVIICGLGTIAAMTLVIHYSKQTTRNLKRAAEYREETAQIRAETDALRQQRKSQ